MIEVTKSDIGRQVVYVAAGVPEREQGEIVSFNDKYVFVKFGQGSTGQGCRREDLEWTYQGKEL